MSERLCVVMPVYNEREAIGPVLEKWAKALDALGIDYTIRPYNDGSKDDSLAVMKAVAEHLPHVEVRDKKNGGHGNTILTGYREAATDGFDWVFQIDSDDEMGPEKFGELWAKRADYDFLIGIRDGRVQQLPRKVISFVSRLCVRLFYGKSVWDVNTPYRLMRVSAFKGYYEAIPMTTFAPNVILSGLAARHNLRCFETRVPQHDRTTGEVSIKKWKLLKAAARSFGQTILFAFTETKMTFARFCLIALAVWGIAFSLFLLVSPLRFMTAIVGGFVVYKLRRPLGRALGGLVGFIEAHPLASLALVLVVGCLERFVFACMFPEIVDQSSSLKNGSDWQTLWMQSLAIADGTWVPSKSWTSAVAYSTLIRAVGKSLRAACVMNALLNFGTSLVLFLIAKRWFGRVAGVLAAAIHFWLPYLAMHSLNVATEPTYELFVTLSLLGWTIILDGKSTLRTLGVALFTGVAMWMTVWSRGEGVLTVITGFSIVIFGAGFCRRQWGRAMLVCLMFAIVAFAGAFASYEVNARTDGSKTIFCSNDNLWPRYFGTCRRCNGSFNVEDIYYINELYRKDHPQATVKPQLEDLTPYLKRETARRWGEMSLLAKVKFVLTKEYLDWDWDIYVTRSTIPYRIFGKLITFPFATFLALGALLFWLKIFRDVLGRVSIPLSLFAIPILLAGNVVVLAVAECGVRYAYLFPMLFGLFVSAGAVVASRQKA